MGEEKLKVVLTPFDMMKYNLTCEKLDYENTETRKAIWNILDHAKHETGFDGARGRICIEVFPEKSGGCIIYISKIGQNELCAAEGIDLSDQNSQEQTTAVFGFDESESLFRVCRSLQHTGYSLPSFAYFEDTGTGKGRYYLELLESSVLPSGKKAKYLKEHLFIGEFGMRMENGFSSSYMREHCQAICEENAVEILAKLAEERLGDAF